jgi:hypothetical protein
MKQYLVVAAALAAIGLSGAAFAGEATAPKAMSNSEMDKVTAGGCRLRSAQAFLPPKLQQDTASPPTGY